jgi:hypothetical protein
MAAELAKNAREAIYAVVEEETGRRLGELTVVTEVTEIAPGEIRVRFTPLSAYSPTAVDLGRRIRHAAGNVQGLVKITVECDGHMQDELVNRLVNSV